MELLSPSGNYSSALSAFNAGSDAIYIGGKAFSARMNAENFSDEEMREISLLENIQRENLTAIELAWAYKGIIDNLDIRIMNATGYILSIRSIQKEKRKLKRKQAFCKVLGISMRK